MLDIYELGLQYTSSETPFWDDHTDFKTDDEEVLRDGKIYLPLGISRDMILQITKKKLSRATCHFIEYLKDYLELNILS